MMSSNGLPRALIGLVLVRSLGELAASAMLPFVVLWAHQQAGLYGTAAGVLFIAQAVGEFAAGLFIGSLADRLGRKRVLVVSTTGMAIAYGFLAAVDAPIVSIALFLLAGVFESAFHPVIGALVGDCVDDTDLRRAFGLVRIGTNASRVLGPLLGAALILLSLRAVFVAAGILLLASALATIIIVPSSRPQEDDSDPEVPPGTLRALAQDPTLSTLVLAAGLLAVAFTWFEADGLVILRRQTSLSADAYAALFAVSALTIVVTQIPINRLTRSLTARTAIVLGASIQAGGLALLLAAPLGYAVLVGSVALTAVGETVAAPALTEVVTLRAGAKRRASYQAALSVSQDIGTALGPTSGLALLGALGPAATWMIGALLSLASGAISAAVLKHAPSGARHPSDQDPTPRAMPDSSHP